MSGHHKKVIPTIQPVRPLPNWSIKHNYHDESTGSKFPESAPTSTDDASKGYSVMSIWIQAGEGNTAWMCVNNTVDNAQWVNIG
jgi:hypothetical protein